MLRLSTLLFNCYQAIASSVAKTKDGMFYAILISRHGHRTPFSDKDLKFWPWDRNGLEFGDLTSLGEQQMELRGVHYKDISKCPCRVSFHSTKTQRTEASAHAVMRGFGLEGTLRKDWFTGGPFRDSHYLDRSKKVLAKADAKGSFESYYIPKLMDVDDDERLASLKHWSSAYECFKSAGLAMADEPMTEEAGVKMEGARKLFHTAVAQDNYVNQLPGSKALLDLVTLRWRNNPFEDVQKLDTVDGSILPSVMSYFSTHDSVLVQMQSIFGMSLSDVELPRFGDSMAFVYHKHGGTVYVGVRWFGDRLTREVIKKHEGVVHVPLKGVFKNRKKAPIPKELCSLYGTCDNVIALEDMKEFANGISTVKYANVSAE